MVASGQMEACASSIINCHALFDQGLKISFFSNVTSHRFRDTVLASGGSRHPRDVFQDFRGRALSSDALLKSYGLQ